VCPFVDKSDARCATHLTLANLLRAFAHCAGDYPLCPVYERLVTEMVTHGYACEGPAVAVGLRVAS